MEVGHAIMAASSSSGYHERGAGEGGWWGGRGTSLGYFWGAATSFCTSNGCQIADLDSYQGRASDVSAGSRRRFCMVDRTSVGMKCLTASPSTLLC
eukprot:6471479-Amphidinium_carterae.1